MKSYPSARWIGGIAMALAVAACGGGGSEDLPAATGSPPPSPATPASTSAADSPAPDLQKYVGDWLTCLPLGPGSYTQRLAMRVKAATALDVTITNTVRSEPACTGAELQTQVTHQVSTFVGTKTIGAVVTDKIGIVYDDGITFKQVMAVEAGARLFLGASTDGPFDSEGYPEKLSTIGRTRE